MKKPSFLKGNTSSYVRRGSTSRTPKSVVTFFIIAVAVILTGIRLVTPGFFIQLTSPLLYAGKNLTAAVASTGALGSSSALTTERDALRDQVNQLQNENFILAARADDLSRLMGNQTIPSKKILAGVISRPPVSPYDILVLGVGNAAGVKQGALVYGVGGIPVGRIQTVNTDSSRALLFSLTGEITAGWVGPNRLPVQITGEGSGAFSALVGKAAGIQQGDGVYVVADGASPIGVVLSIEDDPSSPNALLRIKPYTNPFSLTFVTIGKGSE